MKIFLLFFSFLALSCASYLPQIDLVENHEEWFWKNKNENCRVLNDNSLILKPNCTLKTRSNYAYELGKYCIKVKLSKMVPGTNLTMQLSSTSRILGPLKPDIMKLTLLGDNFNQIYVTFRPARNEWDEKGFEKFINHNSLNDLRKENEFCFRWDFTQFFGRIILYYINGIQVYGNMVDVFIPRNSKLKGSLILENNDLINENDDFQVEISSLKFEELDFLDK